MLLQPVQRFSLKIGMILLMIGILASFDLLKVEPHSFSLRHGGPKSVGIDKNQLNQIDQIMQDAIKEGVFPGGSVLVAWNEQIVFEKAYGYAVQYKDAKKTLLLNPIPARTQTIYDLASISKIFTATAVMQLVEQKKIQLQAPVARYIPEFGQSGKEKVTVRQLLSHTSGMPATLPIYQMPVNRELKLQAVFSCPLVAEPGSKTIYSDIGYITLGKLVETVSRQGLDQYIDKNILRPLKMNSTTFQPPVHLKQRIAATEYQTTGNRGMVWGEVHDENAWSLGGISGHAGIFSTTEDLAQLGFAYLNHGEWDGTRILKPESVQEMTRLQTGDVSHSYKGLGWELNQEWYMGAFARMETFGHTGFTGTSMFIDPHRNVMVILLTNRVHPTRYGPNVSSVRKQLAQIAFNSLYTSESF